MGVVFQATQIALERPVALKAIAPELAADGEYRERFQRESHLAASIDHPNVIPVYEAGESDDTLYLIMRWIDGTDLRELFNGSAPLSARRAIRLLRPVASALAAAQRHGLVHRDVKPANVLIAHGYDDDEEHVYLTDFGIARRNDAKSLTGTGKFVGTIDYMAPERIEGKRGDATCDIYSLGCMLFEALTGHVPFDRPTDVSKMFAHVSEPVPSARAEVDGVPRSVDEIISRSMAKRPEDRYGSAGEMTAALGQALLELETGERTIVSRSQATVPSAARTAELTELPEPAAAIPEPTAVMSEPTAVMSEPTAVMSEPTTVVPETGATVTPPSAPRSRRSPIIWALPVAVLAVAVGLGVILSGGGKTAGALVQIHGSGLTEGRTVTVSGPAGSISVGIQNLWVSLPGRDEIVRSSVATGAQQTFAAAGSPTAIAAGVSAVWVAEPGSQALAQFNGDSGKQVHFAKLAGTPSAIALDQQDSSAWVTDSSGTITHVALGGAVAGTPGHSTPAASSIAWGEGWVWATNGTSKGLVRVDPGTSGSSTAFSAGSSPVGVAVDQGVWTANADGHLTRFDPQPGQLRLNADLAVAPELDAVAATDPGPFVWALSKKTKTLYRVTATGTPAVTGTVVFGSQPVALAAAATSVWVAMQDGKVVQIQVS